MNHSTLTTHQTQNSSLPALGDATFSQRFSALPETPFYTFVKPQGIEKPKLVIANDDLAQTLGIDPASLYSEAALQIFSGNQILPDWQPLAMKYTGHQFGGYNPDLGDGRGLLLADIQAPSGQHYDLHLKGAGRTPYSRFGDGRAVLRSSIREYVCSEAMYALGIPTTRALSLVSSASDVMRESVEKAAMLIRVTPSHIRFGHFEYLRHTNQPEHLKTLADYVIDAHFADIKTASEHNDADIYAAWFDEIVLRTASLMSQWSAVGFVHGVMNTDNFSIIGETFDYGPYGFMSRYQPEYTPNHTDQGGRYAYHQQANIGYWNLSALRLALSDLIGEERSREILATYPDRFSELFHDQLEHKLGLVGLAERDQNLAEKALNGTLMMLQKNRFDMTTFFRDLSAFAQDEVRKTWRDQAYDLESFDDWWSDFTEIVDAHLTATRQTATDRAKSMASVNPAIVPRNHVIQQVITAANTGDYQPLHDYVEALKTPFADGHPAQYINPPAPEEDGIQLSCSS